MLPDVPDHLGTLFSKKKLRKDTLYVILYGYFLGPAKPESYLYFSWLNVLIEWVNFFFVMDPWSVATLCEKIAVNNSILAFFLKS